LPPDDAEIPFDWILADVTGKHWPCEFIHGAGAMPDCKHIVMEKTLVEPK